MFQRRIVQVLFSVVGVMAASIGSRLFAAVPALTQFYPVAVQTGTTTTVSAVGKFDPWPVQVWTDSPGISFEPEKKTGQFMVTVGADVPPGPHLIRLFNDKGVSVPRFLLVTTQPEATEAEPNDHPGKAQPISHLPVTLNGRLNKSGDVDSFAVQLAAGQTLIASVEANVVASPVDAVVRIVDARGVEVALNHDRGRSLDPFLAWTAKIAGTYVVQIFGFAQPATADVKFTGSDACVYRLHLSGGPQARYTLPLGIQRDQPARRRVVGWNLNGVGEREFDLGPLALAPDATQATWQDPAFENTITLPVGDGPEWMEKDIVAQGEDQPALSVPFAVTGAIDQVGEVDRFRFSVTKGDKLVLEIKSASLGFPLDSWLAIQNSAGKELVRNDDGPTPDPLLEWTAPATGTFVALVGSVLQRAGADYLYRLSVQTAAPRFFGVIAEAGFTVEAGKTIKVKATARRVQGFKASLTAAFTSLPEGVTSNPVQLGGNDKDVTLEVTAAADAAAFQGPVQISFKEETAEAIHPAIYELVSTTLTNGVPQGFRELAIPSTNQLWLTVTVPASVSVPAKDPAVETRK